MSIELSWGQFIYAKISIYFGYYANFDACLFLIAFVLSASTIIVEKRAVYDCAYNKLRVDTWVLIGRKYENTNTSFTLYEIWYCKSNNPKAIHSNKNKFQLSASTGYSCEWFFTHSMNSGVPLQISPGRISISTMRRFRIRCMRSNIYFTLLSSWSPGRKRAVPNRGVTFLGAFLLLPCLEYNEKWMRKSASNVPEKAHYISQFSICRSPEIILPVLHFCSYGNCRCNRKYGLTIPLI